jgi:hypothetical protein
MKNLLLVTISMLIISSVFADNKTPVVSPGKGWYVGGDLGGGASRCNTCNTNKITGAVSSTTGYSSAFDMFGGYQFNPYLAVETGIGMPPLLPITTTFNKTYGHNQGVRTETKWAAIGNYYLAVKGMLPITAQFGLFGKAGLDAMGIVYNKYDSHYRSNRHSNEAETTGALGTYLAAGASYNFNAHWTGTVSYNRILTKNGSTKYDSSYGALGFTYLIF